MEAIRIHEHGTEEVLHIDQLNVPRPAEDEVLVRVHATALNHLDIFVRQGIPGVSLPIIPGSDGSGIIEECGSTVKKNSLLRAGEEVFLIPFRSCGHCIECASGRENLCRSYHIPGKQVDGTQAEYVTLPSSYVLPKPAGLSFDEAAAFPLAALTAYHMLVRKVKLKPGDWILIFGASSGVGSFAIQIAKLFGCSVITTIGNESKRKMAEDLGADHILNYREEEVGKKVRSITGQKGVDVVFEHIGEATWADTLRSLKTGGKMITCGATTGAHVRIDLRALFIKHQQLIGSTMGTRQDLLELCELFERNKLSVPIDKVFHYTEIKKAHHHLEHTHHFGKVIVTMKK